MLLHSLYKHAIHNLYGVIHKAYLLQGPDTLAPAFLKRYIQISLPVHHKRERYQCTNVRFFHQMPLLGTAYRIGRNHICPLSMQQQRALDIFRFSKNRKNPFPTPLRKYIRCFFVLMNQKDLRAADAKIFPDNAQELLKYKFRPVFTAQKLHDRRHRFRAL